MWKRIVKFLKRDPEVIIIGLLQNPKVVELVVSFLESLQDGELSTEERESLANKFVDFVAEQIKDLL